MADVRERQPTMSTLLKRLARIIVMILIALALAALSRLQNKTGIVHQDSFADPLLTSSNTRGSLP